MKVMSDGTVKITLNDVKAFDRAKNHDGDLKQVAKRLNKNQREATRRRQIAAWNDLCDEYESTADMLRDLSLQA